MRVAVVVAALALATSSAHAQDHDAPKKKSRTLAQALSGGGAGISSALVLGAFAVGGADPNKPLLFAGVGSSIVTPSLGEWYAGEWFSVGMGIRAASAVVAVFAVESLTDTTRCSDGPGGMCKQLTGTGAAILGLAGIAYVTGTFWDVLDAGDVVDRRNKKAGYIVLAPTILPTPTGTLPGLALAGSF
ncbi:MAG TPA: hypothetical protein VGM88_26860 [Kofleriaceae bacterium]|jgi:hypothetical protein